LSHKKFAEKNTRHSNLTFMSITIKDIKVILLFSYNEHLILIGGISVGYSSCNLTMTLVRYE